MIEPMSSSYDVEATRRTAAESSPNPCFILMEFRNPVGDIRPRACCTLEAARVRYGT